MHKTTYPSKNTIKCIRQQFWPTRELTEPLPPRDMVRVVRVYLAQKLDAVHESGHTCRDVVVAVESNRAVCDCFGGLGVRAGDGDVV
jgi:hypothetical protein